MEHLQSTVVTNSIVSTLIRLPATSNRSDISTLFYMDDININICTTVTGEYKVPLKAKSRNCACIHNTVVSASQNSKQ